MASEPSRGIYVLAGTNGAGKSSILGREITLSGDTFLNPDEMTRQLQDDHPHLSLGEISLEVWKAMVRALEHAIEQRMNLSFETTLGGSTVTGHLLRACGLGIEVRIAYVGLASPELHIERVNERVVAGGHDIPEDRIRSRYNDGRENLIRLLPHATEVLVYDNSETVDPISGVPDPWRVLHTEYGEIVECCEFNQVPEWAKPIVVAAMPSA